MTRWLASAAIVAVFLIASCVIRPSWAQQPPPHPEVVIAKQLLSEAIDRVITLGGQVQVLQAEIARLKAELEKAKAEEKPK